MQVVQGVRLTDNQKRVLCKIVASPSPAVAADEVSGNQNMAGSVAELSKLGLVTQNGSNVQLTNAGQQVMKDYALVDQSGQLSPDGQKYASSDEQGQETSAEPQGPEQPPITEPSGVVGKDDTDQQTPQMTSQSQGSFENYEMRPLKLLKELVKF